MANLLNQEPDYVFSSNKLGATRKYLYESGMLFREFKSHLKIGSLPLIHITVGINPQTGKRLSARGIIAIGRKAVGIIAIGQFALGVISIGQVSFGAIAIGQLAIALTFALGQLSIAPLLAIGQFAVGFAAIGQFAAGRYTLGQFGIGKFVLTPRRQDWQAVCFFKTLLKNLKMLF
ncbi:MAG: hypothetical protein A2173_11850 [Planctomycetes bacterium RBG_13_44_8b]|nr:MAG: hypothetical protein A2173_11850 [Planctomycetes bacterium RBG_13_44_8b]